MQMNSMQDLMVESLCDLRATEEKQLQALPSLIGAIQTPELKQAIQQHEQQTRSHIQRLDQIFQKLGQQPKPIQNPVLDAMVQRAQQILTSQGDPQVKEAALIAEAQKFDHFEMAGYGTAAAFCKILGDQDAARTLAQILSEEKQNDERLSQIAESRSNVQAAKQTM
ncbi:MAG: ferritin-like domain-containing protein [Bacillota bacterium]